MRSAFMSRVKSAELKAKLSKAMRQNRRVPLFAVVKTKRHVIQNKLQRNWRRQKLKLRRHKHKF